MESRRPKFSRGDSATFAETLCTLWLTRHAVDCRFFNFVPQQLQKRAPHCHHHKRLLHVTALVQQVLHTYGILAGPKLHITVSPFRGPCKASTALSCSCHFTQMDLLSDAQEHPTTCPKVKAHCLLGSRWSSFRGSTGLTTSNSHQFCHCRVFLGTQHLFAVLPREPWKSCGFMSSTSRLLHTHTHTTEIDMSF